MLAVLSKTTLFEQPEEELNPENKFINDLEREISEKKLDETGAEREQFAYESAGRMFDQALTFDTETQEWYVKEGYEDISIHAITLPTLSEVNSIGHTEGDHLLNGLREK